MGTKVNSNYEDLLTFTRASKGHALRPVSYGDELVENGDFSSTDLSDWSSYSGGILTLESGELKLTGNAGDITYGATQTINTVVGKVYKIIINTRTSGTAYLRVGTTSGGFTLVNESTTSSTNVTLAATFVASSTSTVITLQGSADATSYFDNISVKEVLFDQPDGTLTLFEHPENVPRVEWDADRNRLGLLVEESRTNLVTYSEDFSQWDGLNQMLPFGSGSTVNATTAPNGTLTADLLVPNTTNSNSHFVRDIVSVTVGNDYTFSVYVKAAGYTTCSLRLYGTDAPITNFDLSAETTDQSAATITNVGGGWYRCTLTGEATSTGSWHYVYPNSQSPFAGDGTSGIYVWGAQVEAGSFPTSYMKTTGDVGDRSADVASIPVADFGYNARSGSFFVEFSHTDPNGTGDGNYALSTSGSSRFLYNNSGSPSWVNFDGTSSVNFGNLDFDGAFSKVAMGMDKNGTNGVVDGGTIKTSTSTPQQNVTASDDLSIGKKYSSGSQLNGHIKSIQYYPRRLTNAQLQDLTS